MSDTFWLKVQKRGGILTDDIQTLRLILHPIDVAEGERIISRSAGPTDLWASDFPFEGDVVGAEMFLRATSTFGEQRPFGFYRITRLSDGLAIGGLGFKGVPQEGCVEIGYGLSRSSRGSGYAAEAIAALVALAKNHEVKKVIATTTPGNIASRRSLLRVGFVLESADDEICNFAIRLQ